MIHAKLLLIDATMWNLSLKECFLKFENGLWNLGLDDSYSLKSLAHPAVMPDFFGFSEAACAAVLIAYVVCASSATTAFDVDGFALPLAH